MLSLLLAAALEFTAQDARLSFDAARTLVETCTPRDAGTVGAHVVAANRLRDAASAVGADVRKDCFKALTPKGEREFANLVVEFHGTDPDAPWTVLVSHYDTKPGTRCPGANDGAATSGLLVGLANAVFRAEKSKGNLMLVWTDGEESMVAYGPDDGLWGSKRAAGQVAAMGRKVRAVICLDMLGDKDLSISLPANGSPKLAKIVQAAAKRMGCPDLVKPIAEGVRDDHVPFLERGYEAVDLIDFSYGPTNSWWHTPQDTMDKLSEDSLLATGRLVVELLRILLG